MRMVGDVFDEYSNNWESNIFSLNLGEGEWN